MIVLINLTLVVMMVVLSFFFYRQFRQALDERVLLQLTSIKQLKKAQVEEYIKSRWEEFESDPASYKPLTVDGEFAPHVNSLFDSVCIREHLLEPPVREGIHDISPCSKVQQAMLVFLKKSEDIIYVDYPDMERIQSILLERTGMQETGETYLVGSDFRLRSQSRFYPDQKPMQIVAETEGVMNGLAGINGNGVIEDYRNIPVYSAYHKLDLPGVNWVVLSELDVEEANIPLAEMRTRLELIFFMICLLGLTLSLLLTGIFTRSLLKMRDFLTNMSKGKYDFQLSEPYRILEIKEMFNALEQLRKSIRGAIQFSSEIGEMNLDTEYKLTSRNDELGKSLIRMREKLAEYEKKERANQQIAKKSLITGQENERQRLARELHDGLGPLLTSLKLTVQSLELEKGTKRKISGIIDDTISEIRRMTYDLMPPALTDFGVGKAMSNFTELIRKSSGISVYYDDATKPTNSRLTPEVNVCLFRVCQELINNTLKHSGAESMNISLTEFDDKVSLYYRDNGKGFDIEKVRHGSGLKNIRERIAVFNGYSHITSSNRGTEVEIEIPLP